MATRAYYPTGVGVGQQVYFYDTVLGPAKGSSLWEGCPIFPWLSDPSIMHVYFADFHGLDKGTEDWILTQATAGTGVAGTLAGGVFTLNAGATTDGQGPQIQLAGIDFLPLAGKTIWFECRVKVSHTTPDLFIGLAELDTTVFASSDMTTANHIGFSSFTGDGILLFDANKATTRVHTLATNTLVAATYVKLGFIVDGVSTITAYVDGVPNATTIATTSVPILGLTPTFGVHATGTDQAVLDIDWVRVAQLR